MLDVIEFLEKQDIPYIKGASGKKLCSFSVGGEVSLAVTPRDTDQMKALLNYLGANGKKHIVLGRGSNVVFSDSGFDGAVVLTHGLDNLSLDGARIKAGAGVSLFKLARFAEEHSLSGLEFAHGIPGSVGGGVYMNAGAFGGEIAGRLIGCECYDRKSGELLTFDNTDCRFAYRHSIFQENKDLLVLSATFLLDEGDKAEIRRAMDEMKAKRASSQPVEFASAGSTFKRPAGHFAGKLIEDCGLKGYNIGGAYVSQKHAGFIVNKGEATASDVVALVEHVRRTVHERYGVMLECEIEFI